jgi:tRNA threonylcarbamoyladenosine biosynthesis protein TsaE
MRVEEMNLGLSIEVESEDETDRLGRALASVLTANTVVGLVGPLGAGKTRLVQAIAVALGVPEQAISSPTFVLIHEYEGSLPVYHFDTYRLRSPTEFEALGADEYWNAGGICLVEWADRVADQLPRDAWMIRITPLERTSRRFELELNTAEECIANLRELRCALRQKPDTG